MNDKSYQQAPRFIQQSRVELVFRKHTAVYKDTFSYVIMYETQKLTTNIRYVIFNKKTHYFIYESVLFILETVETRKKIL